MQKEYEDYYVAFIDILGFKQLLESNISCEEIHTIFDFLQENARTTIGADGNTILAFDEVKYYLMSDSIILYIRSDIEDALLALVETCLMLQLKLILRERPILIRGGIAKGELFVDDRVIYGKALTAAYQLENSVATTPRIVFNKELISNKTGGLIFKKWWVHTVTRKDNDELYYVHYLSKLHMDKNSDIPDAFNCILSMCQWYLDRSYDESIRKKYLWLKKYAVSELEKHKKEILNMPGGEEVIKWWTVYDR